MLKRKKLVGIRRIARLGKYYFGTTMRIPRWPSPAFDRMVANGGLNVEASLISRKRHIDTAILGVTRRCSYGCVHCYDASNRHVDDVVPVGRWIETVQQLQQTGVSVIVFSGGEPMVRYPDLLSILEHADLTLSDFHLHTAGAGLTPQRARELASRGVAAVGIGLDYPDARRHDRFRGVPGAFDTAVSAIAACSEAGVFTYTNLCLQKDLLVDDGLYLYFDLARRLNVGSIQLLEPKPCGKYAQVSPDDLLSDADRETITRFFIEANQLTRFKDYPPVAYTSYYERPENFGCLMGGHSTLSIDGNGNVNPCVFVPVAFGNILHEEFSAIYQRMRTAIPRPMYDTCASVRLSTHMAEHKRRTGAQIIHYDQFRSEWEQGLRDDKQASAKSYHDPQFQS